MYLVFHQSSAIHNSTAQQSKHPHASSRDLILNAHSKLPTLVQLRNPDRSIIRNHPNEALSNISDLIVLMQQLDVVPDSACCIWVPAPTSAEETTNSSKGQERSVDAKERSSGALMKKTLRITRIKKVKSLQYADRNFDLLQPRLLSLHRLLQLRDLRLQLRATCIDRSLCTHQRLVPT